MNCRLIWVIWGSVCKLLGTRALQSRLILESIGSQSGDYLGQVVTIGERW
jgi:hypothetical protein